MRHSGILLGAFVGFLVVGCPGAQNAVLAPPAPHVAAARHKEPVVVHLSKTGLGFRLSDADEEPTEPTQPAVATPLGPQDTKRLFDRLPPLKADADDAVEFALRAKSIPAPRPGETIKEAFPPPVTAGAPPKLAAGPLLVTREEPEGDVELAPYLTVSFSAPMVPITSHDELSKIPVPIKLSPEPPGKWRWVGAQTAMFQPDPRFPMATDYTVDVEAGVRSVTGAVLAEGRHYKFATPTLKLLEHGPGSDSVGLDPVIYASIRPSTRTRSSRR
jgi:alpha-2-macroglobulin